MHPGETIEQISLFGENSIEHERREKLESAVDSIRSKFGGGAIGFGAVRGSDIFDPHGGEEAQQE